ncbi:primary-amine oxidase, partial [Tremellales sp. Uapishka_1]
MVSVKQTNGHKATNGSASIIHPLDPLSAAEIARVVTAIRASIPVEDNDPKFRLWFKAVQLLEPPKKTLAPYLDARAENTHLALPQIARKADALVGIKRSGEAKWFEFVITLDDAGDRVESQVPVPGQHHVPADVLEMVAAEEALMKNEEFIKVVNSLGLPSQAKVVSDAWIYGADTMEKMPRLINFMCYLSFSDSADTNFYAAPLPIMPVVSADTFELVRIDYCPIFGEGERTLQDLDGPFPWEAYASNEYDAAIRKVQDGDYHRKDLKPYRVIQPEGASFSIQGRELKWQKWSFHIGFNYREGVVISDVRYDGRKTFYRLSVSDMTVPYGDPRAPYHRKQAFDLGDAGAGITANELQLGCDCLGEIMSKGVVCIHEQDDGIGWKHTNYRTGKPSVTRSRVLVVQTIITVANYEYIFAFRFDQAAAIHLETRATGILSTAAIMPDELSPYGNVVSPGVLAPNHQHIFSFRIDPAIDGHENTVVQEENVPMPFDKKNPPKDNLYGVGYLVEKTPIKVAGWADAAPLNNRVFKITNPNKKNPISKRPLAYKLVPTPSQMILAHPDSVAYARAEFGAHHVWVTSYKDGELYSGGRYTNQSNGNAEGIRSWVNRKDNTENTDIVLWHSFGLTHNPRVEDFPVMPCETHMVSLKPSDFFTTSPANDVPASLQHFNQSKLHSPAAPTNTHFQGSAAIETEAKENGLNKPCCA